MLFSLGVVYVSRMCFMFVRISHSAKYAVGRRKWTSIAGALSRIWLTLLTLFSFHFVCKLSPMWCPFHKSSSFVRCEIVLDVPWYYVLTNPCDMWLICICLRVVLPGKCLSLCPRMCSFDWSSWFSLCYCEVSVALPVGKRHLSESENGAVVQNEVSSLFYLPGSLKLSECSDHGIEHPFPYIHC